MILYPSVNRSSHCRRYLRQFAKLHSWALFLYLATGCASIEAPDVPIAGPATTEEKPGASIAAVDPVQLVEQKLSGDLGQAVTVAISTSNSDGVWTFLAGRPTTPDGSSIDYSKTQYAEDWSEGYFDDRFVALVKTDATGNFHKLVAYDLGSTDASFVDWPGQYGVPASIVLSE